MKIVKAEILWSRVCRLSCPYCSMATNDYTIKDSNLWGKGLAQLMNMDCGFVAIYGAEPLDDFDLLPEFISGLTLAGIPNTLISSCYRSDTKEKLNILYKNGLRSLTVSYDGTEKYDPSSARKTRRGLEILRWFKEKPGVNDAAVVVTINRKNFTQLPQIIKEMSSEGIWTLFDFIHADRGQRGSKCKNTEDTADLLFEKHHIPSILHIFDIVKEMKEKGHKVHWSNDLLQYIQDRPNVIIDQDWHCTTKYFPSWITVDNTGQVYCCDDFQIKDDDERFYIWDIADRFDEFKEYWKDRTTKECPGCIWGTHWVANNIMAGKGNILDYTHKS